MNNFVCNAFVLNFDFWRAHKNFERLNIKVVFNSYNIRDSNELNRNTAIQYFVEFK